MTGDELKAFRKSKGMNQAELAEKLDKSRKTVVNWETGVFAVPSDIMEQLAAKGILGAVETKTTSKAERLRLEHEQNEIERSISAYRSIRAWPEYGPNHTKAMAYLKREGTVTIHPGAYATLLKMFPDILEDPNGDHAMTKEQSFAVLGILPTKEN